MTTTITIKTGHRPAQAHTHTQFGDDLVSGTTTTTQFIAPETEVQLTVSGGSIHVEELREGATSLADRYGGDGTASATSF